MSTEWELPEPVNTIKLYAEVVADHYKAYPFTLIGLRRCINQSFRFGCRTLKYLVIEDEQFNLLLSCYLMKEERGGGVMIAGVRVIRPNWFPDDPEGLAVMIWPLTEKPTVHPLPWQARAEFWMREHALLAGQLHDQELTIDVLKVQVLELRETLERERAEWRKGRKK